MNEKRMSRKKFVLAAGVIATAIIAGLKSIGIESPVDELTLSTNLAMIMYAVYSRLSANEKIKKHDPDEAAKKFKDPAFWTPFVTIAVEVAIYFTGANIPIYLIPVLGSIVAGLFNRYGPRAPKQQK